MRGGASGKRAILPFVAVQRGGELTAICQATAASRRLPSGLDCRQQQARQHADDRDHDQQFDQRKTGSSRTGLRRTPASHANDRDAQQQQPASPGLRRRQARLDREERFSGAQRTVGAHLRREWGQVAEIDAPVAVDVGHFVFRRKERVVVTFVVAQRECE